MCTSGPSVFCYGSAWCVACPGRCTPVLRVAGPLLQAHAGGAPPRDWLPVAPPWLPARSVSHPGARPHERQTRERPRPGRGRRCAGRRRRRGGTPTGASAILLLGWAWRACSRPARRMGRVKGRAARPQEPRPRRRQAPSAAASAGLEAFWERCGSLLWIDNSATGSWERAERQHETRSAPIWLALRPAASLISFSHTLINLPVL